MATNFGTKLTITRFPQRIIARCFHLPLIYGPGLCNGVIKISSLKTPVVMATKDKIIGCRLTRASNFETQLLGYIAWQRDRYLVSQNVFLVNRKIDKNFLKGPRENVSPGALDGPGPSSTRTTQTDLSRTCHGLFQSILLVLVRLLT